MATETDLLIVFARALRAGKVKTRLMPAVGPEGALAVYRQLLEITLNAATDFPGTVELWTDEYDPALQERAARAGWQYRLQHEGDLGERMTGALADGLSRFRRVLLVGSDCLLLDRQYFQNALAVLETRDVVFGASEDGGYVLLGSATADLWQQNPFPGVRWGTEQALADSLQALASHGGTVETLKALWDVDEPDDLHRAQKQGLLPLPEV